MLIHTDHNHIAFIDFDYSYDEFRDVEIVYIQPNTLDNKSHDDISDLEEQCLELVHKGE